jgi:predicted nucleic acid-binding protein
MVARPRRPEELRDQEALLPRAGAFTFGVVEAPLAAELYRSVRHARGRELDLAIAPVAIANSAALWTLNPRVQRIYEDSSSRDYFFSQPHFFCTGSIISRRPATLN